MCGNLLKQQRETETLGLSLLPTLQSSHWLKLTGSQVKRKSGRHCLREGPGEDLGKPAKDHCSHFTTPVRSSCCNGHLKFILLNLILKFYEYKSSCWVCSNLWGGMTGILKSLQHQEHVYNKNKVYSLLAYSNSSLIIRTKEPHLVRE